MVVRIVLFWTTVCIDIEGVGYTIRCKTSYLKANCLHLLVARLERACCHRHREPISRLLTLRATRCFSFADLQKFSEAHDTMKKFYISIARGPLERNSFGHC